MQLDPVVEQFRIDEIVPDVKVHASTGLLTEVSEDEPVFESGGLWQLTSRRGEPCFRFVSPYFGPTPYKEACFSSDFSSGRIQLHHPYFAASQNVYPLEYPLDELLILNLLSQRRGIEVHACGGRDHEPRLEQAIAPGLHVPTLPGPETPAVLQLPSTASSGRNSTWRSSGFT